VVVDEMRQQTRAGVGAFFEPLTNFVMSFAGLGIAGLGLFGIAMADLLPWALGVIVGLFSLLAMVVGFYICGRYSKSSGSLSSRIARRTGGR
jgi:hypothetical protein